MAIVKGLRRYKARLLAEKVENLDMFKVCKKLGFTYFQGYFFSKPEVIPGRKLSASQTTKIKLLKELNESEAETGPAGRRIIQTDLSISYRLLQIHQLRPFRPARKDRVHPAAVNMLGTSEPAPMAAGHHPVRHERHGQGSGTGAHFGPRGRFLQLLAAESIPRPLRPDSMFLLGFFSVLDAILDQFMDQVLDEIPLTRTSRPPSSTRRPPIPAWIGLLRELDSGDWAGLEEKAALMGIPMALIDTVAIEAAMWTDEVMGGVS
jgi:c-di-GMP phosphodiesterase